MSSPPRVMMGLSQPDIDVWSSRVVTALGQNPGVFTGPGTNTYLVGTGRRRILLDTGDGRDAYLPVLAKALETADCEIQEIVLTHGHGDHIGGVASVLKRYGELTISKHPWPGHDELYDFEIRAIGDGSIIETEGATLRALHTPGHATDHLCFILEEERSLFSGDNVLGVGTTVIPAESGDLVDYLNSLERLHAEAPAVIYPAHGPRIPDGVAKLHEYIGHREAREREIMAALEAGRDRIPAVVELVYAAYPLALHAAAGMSVCSHLLKLEREGRARREGKAPLEARWSPA